MGAHLVSVVYARWTHVSDRAFRVLGRMALVALDSESENGRPSGLYFGGRDLLAMSLQPEWPDGDDDHARQQRVRLRETVRRATAELVKAGAVGRVGAAYTGHRQAYRLTLSTGVPPRDPTGVPPRDPSPADWGPATGGLGSRHGTPKEPEEPQPLGAKTGTRVDQESDSRSGAREPVDNPQDRNDETDVCPACGVLLDPGRVCGNRQCHRYRKAPP